MIKRLHRFLDLATRGIIAALLGAFGVLVWQPTVVLGPLWLGAWIMLTYVAMSLLTALLYASDKRRAKRQGAWRTPEAVLLRLNLAGGWAGGAWGQWGLRHKTQKPLFLRRFWLALGCHVMAWSALILRLLSVI